MKRLIVFVLLLFLLISCQSPESKIEISQIPLQQKLTFAEATTIPSMDTTQATDTISFTTMNNVFEGLYRLNQQNMPVEGMAVTYTVSEDGRVYTFTIREDAYWSNGDRVSANDFVFAWKKALHPQTLSPYAYIMNDIKNASRILDPEDELYGEIDKLGVQALDEKTLEVTLESPIPYFLSLTAFPTFFPQNEKFVVEHGNQYALGKDHLVYNGPFILQEWKQEKGWTYKKNPTYWDQEAVQLEEVQFLVVKEPTTITRLYETGVIDRAGLTAEYVDKYKDRSDFNTLSMPFVTFLRFNQKKDDLANVHIRKALAHAWDKDGIANIILNNGSKPAYFFIPTQFVSGPDGTDFRFRSVEFREGLDQAREYWKKGLLELGKSNIELELLIYDSENSSTIGQYIKNQLEKHLEGLTITIKQQPFQQKMVLEKNLDYDISFSGWGPDYADPMTFLDMFVTGSGNNLMNYSNREYDRLIRSGKINLQNLEERWDNLHKAERILLEEDAAIAPMYQGGSAYLLRPNIKNLIIHPFGPGKTFKWAYVEQS